MRISLISTDHHFNDDRLYYHFAKSLYQNNHVVEIVTCEALIENKDGIRVSSFNGKSLSRSERKILYIEKLTKFKPDLIICSEPITVLVAKQYAKNKKVRVIYDITEFYPSKIKLKQHPFGTKLFYAFLYIMLFIYACKISDGYIIGEYFKGLVPRKLFPKKKNIKISYYPDNEYITGSTPHLKENTLRLCYSGNLSVEKGVINFLNVINKLITQNKELRIFVKIIGEFNKKDESRCKNIIDNFPKNVRFKFYKFQELKNYVKLINDTDVFLDLRSNDFINSHCLPIKLFYFMSLQRPVIFFNSNAIKREIDISSFGFLVNPKDSSHIAKLLLNYISNQDLYYSHCSNAKNIYEANYQWNLIEPEFINFIKTFK